MDCYYHMQLTYAESRTCKVTCNACHVQGGPYNMHCAHFQLTWSSILVACLDCLACCNLVPTLAGEPRNIADPANRPFMESISKGECPAELDPGSRTQQVSVNLVRSEKPYEAPPKPKYKAFTGTGQTLAGETLSICFLMKHSVQIQKTDR